MRVCVRVRGFVATFGYPGLWSYLGALGELRLQVRSGAGRPELCSSTDIGVLVGGGCDVFRFVATFGCPGGAPCAGTFWDRKTGSVQFYRHLRSGGGVGL